jgi:two-component system response regulator RegX3
MATTNNIRVLVVEDEETLAESIRYNLEREGYGVAVAANGRAALREFHAYKPDLLLLDLMLPEVSGLDVCRAIRSESSIPIIIVTAKDAESDSVAGLELGADDYVTKPFSMNELIARVRANLRRAYMAPVDDVPEERLQAGPVELDITRHEAVVAGQPMTFRPKEFALLSTFLRRPGRLLTRDFLIEEVWGPGYFGDTKTLDVHIKRIRQKIEPDPHRPRYLVTVRGLGYKYMDEATDQKV